MKALCVAVGLIVVFSFIGCEKEQPLTPAVSIDKLDTFHVYITVTAEGSSYSMPFAGECDLWVSDQPMVNPPPRDPDGSIAWYSSQGYPITLNWQHGPDDPKYLLWVGWQTVAPPNGDYQTRTRVYSGSVAGSENYYGSCVFYLE